MIGEVLVRVVRSRIGNYSQSGCQCDIEKTDYEVICLLALPFGALIKKGIAGLTSVKSMIKQLEYYDTTH